MMTMSTMPSDGKAVDEVEVKRGVAKIIDDRYER